MVQIIAWLLLVAALIGGAEWYVHGKVEAGKTEVRTQNLERDLKEEKQVNEQKQAVIDYADKKSKLDYEAAKIVAARMAAMETKMAELAKRDPKVAAWAVTPVPDSVRELRRSTFSGTPQAGLMPDTGKVVAANAGAADERPDQRQLAVGSGSVASSADSVQQGKTDGAGRAGGTKSSQSILDIINKIHPGLKE